MTWIKDRLREMWVIDPVAFVGLFMAIAGALFLALQWLGWLPVKW